MRRIRVLLIVALAIIVALAATGCGGNQATSGQGSATSGSSSSSGTMAKQPEFVWRMQVIHNTGQSDFEQNKQTAEKIYKATNGRLKIEVHPNGTFASSMEAFQAAGDGVFEMLSSWPIYAKGIDYAFVPLGTGNLTMDAHDKWVWVYEAGGWDLLQKAFDKINLKLLAVEIWGTEVLMANQPFKSIEEMKGKKMRTSDPRLLEKNGVAAITMPLEEVFTAMSTGAVDMAEFGNLDWNKGIGLTDVAKYGIWPDFWNVHFITTVVVNKNAWNKLPPDIQQIVEMAFQSDELKHWTRSQYRSAITMKELEKSGKMQFVRMPEEQFIKLREQMYEIEQEDIKKYGGLTAEVYQSLYKFMEDWYPYKDIARWWGWGLTPEQQLGYQPKK
ncbi:Bacterial extracellular solute-binding protein,family 7 [Moorella glycerini]|uniref:Lactate-binding periplasmic protein n=1 Tax=Neomoorella stamsii TaxID=1266720 RepID=A0A9X7J1Z0_9FIRM|nr:MULTISPECIES: TRAP transporter substrate-binding protein DctP [Moorella]PRR71689.1 Lactate-binding periplasmic protein precursor [Moorella stamsii]CEP66933.1 Bacterial extracellular solute-binding protein,family 7 [Moorella glycerini]